MIHRTPLLPPLEPPSSPRKASPRRTARIRSTMSRSAARSICVTTSVGLLLVSTTSGPAAGRLSINIRPASRAVPTARSSRSARLSAVTTSPYGPVHRPQASEGPLPSQQLGAFPLLRPYVVSEEGEHGLVPHHRVARRQDPVVLVREVQELGLHLIAVEVEPLPERVADRHPV